MKNECSQMFPDVCWIWWLVGRCQEQESRIATLGPNFWTNSGYLQNYICILQTTFNPKWILVPSWWGQLLSVFSYSVVKNYVFPSNQPLTSIKTRLKTKLERAGAKHKSVMKTLMNQSFQEPWCSHLNQNNGPFQYLLWFKYWCSS